MFFLIIKGLATGLLFAFSFGPAFFANINASMSRGFKAGAMVVAGISLSDSTFALLSIFGLSALLGNPTIQFWITIIGGCLITVFGLLTFLKPVKPSYDAKEEKATSYHWYFLQGLLINGLSPYIIIFWAGVVSTTIVEMSLSTSEALYFFGGVLLTMLSMDLLKAALANKIYDYLGPDKMTIISKSVGFILITIGIALLISLTF